MDKENLQKIILGMLIILLGLSTMLITHSFKVSEDTLSDVIIDLNDGSCILENNYCLHMDRDYTKFFFGIMIGLATVVMGVYVLYSSIQKPVKKEFKEPKDLDEDEKIIYDLIKAGEGSVYQSDLVKKTDYSKVRITRILDKLENKKILERKRRGMTNIVVLK